MRKFSSVPLEEWEDKLQFGFEQLADAKKNTALLTGALTSFHGALEDFFRDWLSSCSDMPDYLRRDVKDVREVQWKGLVDLVSEYGDIKAEECNYILETNRLRQRVAHGGRSSLDRKHIESYGRFVKEIIERHQLRSKNSKQAEDRIQRPLPKMKYTQQKPTFVPPPRVEPTSIYSGTVTPQSGKQKNIVFRVLVYLIFLPTIPGFIIVGIRSTDPQESRQYLTLGLVLLGIAVFIIFQTYREWVSKRRHK